MFSGIVTDIGTVVRMEGAGTKRLIVTSHYDFFMLGVGMSIACDGICLTVTEKGRNTAGWFQKDKSGWFAADLSPETLARTTASQWQPGQRLNLERGLCAGDELGGHFVTGHVDSIIAVTKREEMEGSRKYALTCPDALTPFIAPKGSVTLNGVALTVNEVEKNRFDVMLIPHTLAVTTWADAREGDQVNLEVDVLARYVRRAVTGN